MLCTFAQQFPPFVERFGLSRRFREETVTDIMMGGLLTSCGPGVLVDFPDERVTGADMRWDFVNTTSNAFFCLFLQAKRLYTNAHPWRLHEYRKLFATTGTTGVLQAKVLCDHARTQNAAYPLYIFYNPEDSCAGARADHVTNIEGVTLADGYEIERRVLAARSGATRRTARELRSIQPIKFLLPDLFCPPTVRPIGPMAFSPGRFIMPFVIAVDQGRAVFGVPLPPRPEDIRARLAEAVLKTRQQAGPLSGQLPGVPRVAEGIPPDVQARIRRHRSGEPAEEERVPYWRVTFLSSDIPRREEGAIVEP